MNVLTGTVIKTWELKNLLSNPHLLDCDGERTFIADINNGVIGSVPQGLVDYLIDLKELQGNSGFKTQLEYSEEINKSNNVNNNKVNWPIDKNYQRPPEKINNKVKDTVQTENRPRQLVTDDPELSLPNISPTQIS